MRLIDADALKEYIDTQKDRVFTGCTVGEALKMITDEQPTIDIDKVSYTKGYIDAMQKCTDDLLKVINKHGGAGHE